MLTCSFLSLVSCKRGFMYLSLYNNRCGNYLSNVFFECFIACLLIAVLFFSLANLWQLLVKPFFWFCSFCWYPFPFIFSVPMDFDVCKFLISKMSISFCSAIEFYILQTTRPNTILSFRFYLIGSFCTLALSGRYFVTHWNSFTSRDQASFHPSF